MVRILRPSVGADVPFYMLDRLPGTPGNTYFLVLKIFAKDELIPTVRHLLA